VCVKYTTARALAEKTVNIALEKLERPTINCRTEMTPIYGGHIKQFYNYLSQQVADAPYDLKPAVIQHLVYNYGSEYRQVLKYIAEDARWGQVLLGTNNVIKAEIVHSIRQEMACKLLDVILRRTELGTGQYPGDETVKAVAEIMREELSWSYEQMSQEITRCKQLFHRKEESQVLVAV
jgi:glycerol-3-phosphate dehydrogenase